MCVTEKLSRRNELVVFAVAVERITFDIKVQQRIVCASMCQAKITKTSCTENKQSKLNLQVVLLPARLINIYNLVFVNRDVKSSKRQRPEARKPGLDLMTAGASASLGLWPRPRVIWP